MNGSRCKQRIPNSCLKGKTGEKLTNAGFREVYDEGKLTFSTGFDAGAGFCAVFGSGWDGWRGIY
jgi:hypothetical protein